MVALLPFIPATSIHTRVNALMVTAAEMTLLCFQNTLELETDPGCGKIGFSHRQNILGFQLAAANWSQDQ